MFDCKEKPMEFKAWARYALFTDPISKIGGEKCSYHIPTYDALKGIVKSIYWKPTFIWIIDEVRIMKPIRTQTKGVKPIKMSGGNDLSIYTFLVDVEYQVRAHFEWNFHRKELAQDRNMKKHSSIASRMLERGGRQDIFFGTRDCQGYVEPCRFGEGDGAYDDAGAMKFSLTYHGFDYPDETGEDKLMSRFWYPEMKNGIVEFDRPEKCKLKNFVRDMKPKTFSPDRNLKPVSNETEY